MDQHHVFTVISGFGLRVIPRAPYRASLGPNSNELDVEHDSPDGGRFARVVADREGGYTSKIDAATASLRDVVDVEAGPKLDRWHLDARWFLAPLPRGFALHSVAADSPSPFDLVGPNDCLIFAQSPQQVPDIATLCGPGQTILDRGADWLEVAYVHEGSSWWQRHQIAAVSPKQLLFTAQALEKHREVAMEGLSIVLDDLVAGEGVA